MKEFTFEVIQHDRYQKVFVVKAESLQEAREDLKRDLDELPIDHHSNTLAETTVSIRRVNKKK
jgi:hypothetical protein